MTTIWLIVISGIILVFVGAWFGFDFDRMVMEEWAARGLSDEKTNSIVIDNDTMRVFNYVRSRALVDREKK